MNINKVTKLILASLLLSPLAGSCADAPASQTVLVSVHPEKPGVKIQEDFLGFSFEKKMLSIEAFHPGNAVLITLFTNLGGGVLRVGANEGDSTFWFRTEVNPPAKLKSLGYSLKPLTIGPLSLDHPHARRAANAASAMSLLRRSGTWISCWTLPSMARQVSICMVGLVPVQAIRRFPSAITAIT